MRQRIAQHQLDRAQRVPGLLAVEESLHLAAALRQQSKANTLVLVEHDPQLMSQADRLVDIGPGPGEAGGRIVFDGVPSELSQSDTLTAQYLLGRKQVVPPSEPLGSSNELLVLNGIRANNLKGIDFKLPLNRLVVLTGVCVVIDCDLCYP